MRQESLAIFFAILLFIIGYGYLYYNGTYWLNKNAEMSKFTNLYYTNGKIIIENNEGIAVNYLLIIKNSEIIKNETIYIENKERKNIDFLVREGDIIILEYNNKSLMINPLG